MKRIIIKILLPLPLVVIFGIITGCVTWHYQAADIEPAAKIHDKSNYTDLGYSWGESSSFRLLWFIPVTKPVSYDEAVDDAITKKGGDNLIEVRTYIERQIWVAGSINVLHVKGKVIRYNE